MMYLVLDHRPQPLPNRDLGSAGRHARPRQVLGGEGTEDLHRLAVTTVEVLHHPVPALGELRAVTRIPARPQAGILGEHVALDAGEMTQQVGEAELARLIRPFELLAWDAG